MGCHLEKITGVVVWSSNRGCYLESFIGVVICGCKLVLLSAVVNWCCYLRL